MRKQSALVSTVQYCEEGLVLTDEGYPKGVGWRLLRNLEGLAREVNEIQEGEAALARSGIDAHGGHRHHRPEIAARYDWHYWPDDGVWMVENMASGRTQGVAEAILN